MTHLKKPIRVAINGFGRIGRSFFRAAHDREDIDIVAVNDLGDLENLAYLLRYDTAQGKVDYQIHIKDEEMLVVDDVEVKFTSIPEPSNLPWKELDIDVVVESTGVFTTYEKAKAHLDAGAKRVVISAPVKDEPLSDLASGTVLLGVNEERFKTCLITSNASCTTNAGSPVIEIMRQSVGIEKALLNTVHGYTASQSLVDGPHKKDWRRGRAAAQNIIPSSTGAAIATTKAIPELEGKFDGVAIRVPVIAGSIVDITFLSKKDTSVEEINGIFKDATKEERWMDVLSVTEEPVVSSDIIGSRYASIVDLSFTKVVDGNLCKVLAWYDNEMGYTHTLVRHVEKLGAHI
jgi:glyceraldehyde 3-phosphate dehydrogenase